MACHIAGLRRKLHELLMIDYAAARRHMVDSQLRPNRVTDQRLLGAFLAVPRERFVPAELAGVAYIDEDIHIGGGRYLVEPMVLGRLLQAALVGPGDRVLDIGCATGYSTAILATLAARVTAIEEVPGLVQWAGEALSALDLAGITVLEGPLVDGDAQAGPYDVILIGGAVADIPAQIAAQLAPGGRLVTVIKAPNRIGKAVLMEPAGGTLSRRELFDASVPLLPGFVPQPSFQF
jgi:protein-L-isoaspartate(D-aspartate) O-methyltransferase